MHSRNDQTRDTTVKALNALVRLALFLCLGLVFEVAAVASPLEGARPRLLPCPAEETESDTSSFAPISVVATYSVSVAGAAESRESHSPESIESSTAEVPEQGTRIDAPADDCRGAARPEVNERHDEIQTGEPATLGASRLRATRLTRRADPGVTAYWTLAAPSRGPPSPTCGDCSRRSDVAA